MSDTAIIFGAGKTGRGFAAHLAYLGNYRLVLVDKSQELIDQLKEKGKYSIQILGNDTMSTDVIFSGAYHVDDPLWHDELIKASVAFTAVFGNNLEELSKPLALALQKRQQLNGEAFLTIITCENLTNAARFLKDKVLKNISDESKEWLLHCIGFSEAIIFKTCLDADVKQDPLTIRAQNFFELPCDGDAIKQPLPVYGLKPLSNFQNQLKRKIYTYNCINAVITYLGAEKGYTQLYEAGNNEEILDIAKKAASETSKALIAEYDFDAAEQNEWVSGAFKKFSDRNIPDPIERNGADPLRKLGRDDRLIGPALLALRYGIEPEGLLSGILACFNYYDDSKKYRIIDLIKEKGIDVVLNEVCGLSKEEKLFILIKEKMDSKIAHGN